MRKINYMRLSVTDRCNLKCIYCTPSENIPKLSHENILTYEELLRVARVSFSLGISKIRLTGGEPLVRKGIVEFTKKIVDIAGVGNISITTNGTLLEHFAKELFSAGIRRVNISLDTLKKDKFVKITRRNLFDDVLRGIEASMMVGFKPVKINVVVLKDINDDEIEDFAKLTLSEEIHVRFIEFMPFGSVEWERGFVSVEEIMDRLKTIGDLQSTISFNNNGPAKYFQFRNAKGKIGIINPITDHFCDSCNRIRITPEGHLRTCLFSSEELDLRYLLRSGASDEELKGAIWVALNKKSGAREPKIIRKCIGRPMSSIGG